MTHRVNRLIIEYIALADEGAIPVTDESFTQYLRSVAAIERILVDLFTDDDLKDRDPLAIRPIAPPRRTR